ncbi:MAG: UdgX family uracil-DNA binding protein [Blastocatellia bacterium]|nr:UdgX family uracil-DNA binding protein [Blastocatellia bacterium]
MSEDKSALDYFPPQLAHTSLSAAAQHCKGCDLYKDATQAVFGEGSLSAKIMFVGEQPGDEEDLSGHPFVGPAGKILRKAFDETGLDPTAAYITNVVKHFKWKPRGKRRIHEKPRLGEIAACTPWLGAEIEIVKPSVLVCLGATAAQTLFGRDFRITRMRGQWLASEFAPRSIATYHPSAILRAPNSDARDKMYSELSSDIAKAVAMANNSAI